MNRILLGAVAGAAGTIALDFATYVDMAVRGRSSSNVPAEVVRKLAEKLGAPSLVRPDSEASDTEKNRRSALGALSGYVVGIGVAMLYGAMNIGERRLPALVGSAFTGGLAMAASDVPAARLGATDVKSWDTSAWISDIVPHAIYGITTAFVYDALWCACNR